MIKLRKGTLLATLAIQTRNISTTTKFININGILTPYSRNYELRNKNTYNNSQTIEYIQIRPIDTKEKYTST